MDRRGFLGRVAAALAAMVPAKAAALPEAPYEALARRYAGVSYCASGRASNVIDYITIESAGNASDFGDLTVCRGGGDGNLVERVVMPRPNEPCCHCSLAWAAPPLRSD